MEKTRKTKVDERMWWAVKTLLKGGSTLTDASEYFMLSVNTCSRIKQSESYEDYKQALAAMHAAYRKQKSKLPEKQEEKKEEAENKPQVIEHRQSVTIQATHYMMTEMQKTNELLTAISAKLAFIVDELCGTKGGSDHE